MDGIATIRYLTTASFGYGAAGLLAEVLAELAIARPLIVTDAGVRAAGITDRVVDGLDGVTWFARTPANPTDAAVAEATAVYADAGCDGVVAIGGGSSIDLAKGVALLATHPGPLAGYAMVNGGLERITAGVAPTIAVPTTAGTGSEVGRAAMINVGQRKLDFISPHLFPARALCDPELTLGLHRGGSAATPQSAADSWSPPPMGPPALVAAAMLPVRSPPSVAQRHAEMAGAGLAGLATAAALAQRGWSVRLHEQGPELREIGAGIYLFDNALRALEAIGAYDDVAARAEHVREMELRDHRNELVRGGHHHGVGGRTFIALRSDLHAALVRAAVAAGVEIVTSSRALAADPGGRLEFEHGFGDQADLVVGSDGVYSAVRDSLRLATSIVDLQDGCGRHLIPREPDDPVQRTIEVWSAGRRLGVAPASRDRVYIFLCCPAGDIAWRNQQPFDPAAWLRSHPWYHRQLERIPRHPEGRWISFYDVRCRAWSAGRVALVGDAAHAMSPNLGQGACVALANGIALADAVTGAQDIPFALREWERRERPIVDLTQRYSYLYGAVGTRWPKPGPLLDLRTALVRRALLPVLERRTAPITTHAAGRATDRG